jgi:hypothetical protein
MWRRPCFNIETLNPTAIRKNILKLLKRKFVKEKFCVPLLPYKKFWLPPWYYDWKYVLKTRR